MNILSSELFLAAEHSYRRVESSHERLQINDQVRERQRDREDTQRGLFLAADRADISALARARAFEFVNAPSAPAPIATTTQTPIAEAISAEEAALRNDPNLGFLIDLIEALTGEKVRLFDSDELSASDSQSSPTAQNKPAPSNGSNNAAATNTPPGLFIDYQRREVIEESEATTFTAQGVVRTADGQEIAFEVQLEMARSYREESTTQIQIGKPPPRKDPLVLNFSGAGTELLDQRFSFDIDADGKSEALAMLDSGSGFVVFDRNNDGRVNDGRELFGALSGDGYADLAQLDDDGNGWIDSGDAAFAQLQLWTPTANGGGALQSLSERDVAAISTANIATPFGLRGDKNSDLGAIRATGVYLSANHAVGTSQQIDLSV